MSKFNTFVQLKELMFAMEQDLGISALSEPEKCCILLHCPSYRATGGPNQHKVH